LLLAGLGKGGNSYFETDYLCFYLARPHFHTTLPFLDTFGHSELSHVACRPRKSTKPFTVSRLPEYFKGSR